MVQNGTQSTVAMDVATLGLSANNADMIFHLPSSTPEEDLKAIAYEGQPVNNYLYRRGYENLFTMPRIEVAHDKERAIDFSVNRLKLIANRIKTDNWLSPVEDNQFRRTVVGIEKPTVDQKGNVIRENREIVTAEWGKNFSSPVHGHGEGLLFEELLFGKMLVSTYFISDLENKIVRPHTLQLFEADMYGKTTSIANVYVAPGTHKMHKRESFVHSFKAIEYSASLHIVPEHTRDGRDNTFTVEHYTLNPENVKQITGLEAMYALIGTVIAVRSINVPEYGDHYIMITGAPIMKPHGLLPMDIEIPAGPQLSEVLDKFTPTNGVILLQLNTEETQNFLNFHNIEYYGH